MLKNLITDLKVTAMDMVGDIQTQDLSYMNGWNSTASRITATQIDMISDKINFISEMIQSGLLGFDAIEEELRMISTQPNPPQPAQLMSLAARIDTTQRQAFDGLQKLRVLAIEIDRATDKLQGTGGSDWNTAAPRRTGW